MDDVAVGGEDQRVADLVGEGGDVGPLQRALAAQGAGEGLAVEVLHREVVAPVVLAEVELELPVLDLVVEGEFELGDRKSVV